MFCKKTSHLFSKLNKNRDFQARCLKCQLNKKVDCSAKLASDEDKIFHLFINFCCSVKDSTVNGVITGSDCKDPNDDYSHTSDKSMLLLVCPTKPPKRKDRRDSCGQERKLIRWDYFRFLKKKKQINFVFSAQHLFFAWLTLLDLFIVLKKKPLKSFHKNSTFTPIKSCRILLYTVLEY